VGGSVVKMGCWQEESDKETVSGTGCKVRCVVWGAFREGLHGCGSCSGAGRDGGGVLVGENGLRARAIMSRRIRGDVLTCNA